MCRMADRSQQRRAAAWHSPRCHRGQQPFTPNALSTPLRVSALFQVMRALFRHAYGLERPFSKGIPVETKWNSSGQIPLPQGLMAEPDPLGGNHTTPGGAASYHPPMPPPPALPEHCKPCLKPRHRSTWAGQPTQLCVQVWDHAHPPYPVMLGASLTESKDVAKASGPVQNSLIQAYIVCVSDSLFSQHLGTLTLICV